MATFNTIACEFVQIAGALWYYRAKPGVLKNWLFREVDSLIKIYSELIVYRNRMPSNQKRGKRNFYLDFELFIGG
jgi:hypothetical protein